MLILKKKHNELLEKAKEESYRVGLLKGNSIATEKMERGFRNTLEQYNKSCIELEKKKSVLTLKINNLENKLVEKEKNIVGLALMTNRTQELLCTVRIESNEEIRKLKNILRKKDSKEITRYEHIAKTTKKTRVKEKAEKKILELKERELYFE
ncbi:MAG: hypothetical protein ACRC0V_01765 [Fusobacteriaceae bacterium]|uniref:hypothetical protein n=1 Tax=Romboutsia sp. TaxID=1965302 RepID=UPI003F3E0ED2